jgi:ABC-2 type transport system ATP-binding protein
MIEARGLEKRYGDRVAVHDLSFTARPGTVTGFLGPNGAGKSTTMRMILGLDRPTRGEVRVNGRRYRDAVAPMHEVGVMLEARAVHTGRTAAKHLLALAQTHGISRRRVDEVIEMVGLTEVARRRAGGFSLGMGQRLGIASALLGDPATLILDEPVNGLDPEGIRWIRSLLRDLAAEGRTVFLSSHLMSEMAMTATNLVIVGRGRLIAETTVDEVIAGASPAAVHVRTPASARLREVLAGTGVTVTATAADTLEVTGRTCAEIGQAALASGVVLHELIPRQVSLEDAFMNLTHDAVEYGTPLALAGAPRSEASA